MASSGFKSGGMLTVNSSENYLAAGLAGLGIIQIPAHCRARSPACRAAY
ncbi:LysR family transcriptional regulator [Escherichia coli]|uniref:LysR family transcriptional regulator n=1 Tax=Escherichia coli TaxID=562 RepID=A0A377BW79_ECOLX|nr:LysR family transcriptional regulator [Escherichia coli]